MDASTIVEIVLAVLCVVLPAPWVRKLMQGMRLRRELKGQENATSTDTTSGPVLPGDKVERPDSTSDDNAKEQ